MYRNTLMICQLNGGLREVKNNRTFHSFSSKSGRSRLREVVAHKRLGGGRLQC